MDMIHTFELAGLGTAPFRCVGVCELPSPSLAEANPTAYMNAMRDLPRGYSCGTCAYCGQAIRINFLIQGSDGSTFAVGSECVRKTNEAGLIKAAKALKSQRDRMKRQAAKVAAREAELQAQRDRNGGQTDWEVREAKRVAEYEAQEAARKARAVPLLPLADLLEDRRGGFRDDIAHGLRQGILPRGRGLDIMLDILGKLAGRAGSRAYQDEIARIELILVRH